ncbi:uncharacterized protein TNCV_4932651 [Trichonephila clavipes]|nr:uncharacterized protein TNCV_4932651 [Trichonephila clavipes]
MLEEISMKAVMYTNKRSAEIGTSTYKGHSSRCTDMHAYQTNQLPHVAKVDLVGQLGVYLGQSLSNHGPYVFYRRKIRRASRPGKQFNLVIDEKPLDNACHVWSHIILLKYGCGQALKARKDNWLQHLGDVSLAV